jgi:WD40 repeat protein
MALLHFSPDGRWLATCSALGTNRVVMWPPDAQDGMKLVHDLEEPCGDFSFHQDGQRVLVGTRGGSVFALPIGAGAARRLETEWEGKVQFALGLTIDASGRRAAASPFNMNPSIRDPELRTLRVWDLASGEGRAYSLAHLTDESWWGFDSLRFLPDGRLLASGLGAGGVVRLSLPSETTGVVSRETLHAAGGASFDLSADGRRALVWASRSAGADHSEELLVLDLTDGTRRRIETHGQNIWWGAIDSSGQVIATGDTEGVVRVGPADGGEPHLLLGGHAGTVWSVAISPDGRWVASVGDEAIHLWPMPDVTKPPLHTLPHEELMAKLDALTNLRVVRDPDLPSGWKLDIGPFPGWEDVPTW